MYEKKLAIRLVKLLLSFKGEIVIIIACLLILSGINFSLPILSQRIMDDGIIAGDYNKLVFYVSLLLFAYLIYVTVDVLKEKIRINIHGLIQEKLTKEAYAHLMHMEMNYFNNNNSTKIFSNLDDDINRISSICDENVFFVITQAFSIIGGIIGLCLINTRLTIIVITFIPIKTIIMKCFAKKQKKLWTEGITFNQEYANLVGETISAIREIKLYDLYAKKRTEILAKKAEYIRTQKKLALLLQYNVSTDLFLVQLLISIIYIAGMSYILEGRISVGSIFAFVTYSVYVTGPISSILNIGYFWSGILPSAKRFYEFIGICEEDDIANNSKVSGDIEFVGVSFGYDNDLLHDINFKIKKGEKVAIVGENGSGKTTLLNLLLRIDNPQNGEILVGGKNIQTIALNDYRSIFSVVSQDAVIFNDSLYNNICLYKDISIKDLEKVCDKVGLSSFVTNKGFDYMLGVNGANLSGGQKQKVLLARALIYNKDIFVFDEATSNADETLESQINLLINTTLREKTVIIITHKKDILNSVDKVYMIKNQEIVPYEI